MNVHEFVIHSPKLVTQEIKAKLKVFHKRQKKSRSSTQCMAAFQHFYIHVLHNGKNQILKDINLCFPNMYEINE